MLRPIERIFIHCTASQPEATVEDIMKEFWRKKWKSPGYHYLIDMAGGIHQLLDESRVSNGVAGFNTTAINVAYIGGIDRQGKAKDTRTDAQKVALRGLITGLHEKYPSATILGHRDISPDKNGNGIVDPWERIKECPCFDAKIEYADIQKMMP